MIPQYRIEQYLAAINAAYLGGSPLPEYPSEPVWHIERMLAAIYDVVSGSADPHPFPERSWHMDEFLYAIYCALSGDSSAVPPAPSCRLEMYLASIYGALVGNKDAYAYSDLDCGPQWREEEILQLMLEAVEGHSVPSTYREIVGITFNNDAYYEVVGFKMRGSDTLRFSFKCTMSAPACNVLGAYDGSSAQSNYSLYLGDTSSAKYMRYNGGTYRSDAEQDVQYDVVISPTGVTGLKAESTWTEKAFESSGNLCIGTTSTTATSSKMVGDIIGRIKVDGRLELVPCVRMSDGAIGYYETHSGTFYENVGTGTPKSLGYVGAKSINEFLPVTINIAPTSVNGVKYSYDLATQMINWDGENTKHSENSGAKIGASYTSNPALPSDDVWYFSAIAPHGAIVGLSYADTDNIRRDLVYIYGDGTFQTVAVNGLPNDFASLAFFTIGHTAESTEVSGKGVVEISRVPPTYWSPYFS